MKLPLIRMTLADYVAAGCDTELATINICNRDDIPCVQPGETLPAALRRLHGEQETSPDDLEIVCPDDVPKVMRGVSEYDAGDYTGAWDKRPDAKRMAVELVLPTVAEWRAYPKEAHEFAVDATYWPDIDEAAWEARDAEACAANDPGAVISVPDPIPVTLALFAAHAPEMPRWFARNHGCIDAHGEWRVGDEANSRRFQASCLWRWFYANQMLAARKAGAA